MKKHLKALLVVFIVAVLFVFAWICWRWSLFNKQHLTLPGSNENTSNQLVLNHSFVAYHGSRDIGLIDDALNDCMWRTCSTTYYQFTEDDGQQYLAFQVMSNESVLETKSIAITDVNISSLDYRSDGSLDITLTVTSTQSTTSQLFGSIVDQAYAIRALEMIKAHTLVVIPIDGQITSLRINGLQYQPFAGGWVRHSGKKNGYPYFTYTFVNADLENVTGKTYEGYHSLGEIISYIDKNGQDQTYDWSGIVRAWSDCGNDLITDQGEVLASCINGGINHYAPGLLIVALDGNFDEIKTLVVDIHGQPVSSSIDGYIADGSHIGGDFTDARSYKVYEYFDPAKAMMINGARVFETGSEQYGVIDHDLNIIVPPIYDAITIYQDCQTDNQVCHATFEVNKNGETQILDAPTTSNNFIDDDYGL